MKNNADISSVNGKQAVRITETPQGQSDRGN